MFGSRRLQIWDFVGGGSWRKGGGSGVLSYCFVLGYLAEEAAWGVGVFEVGFERGVR